MADAPRSTARGRLSRSAEFDRVYRQGRSAQHRLLVLYRFDRPDDVAGPIDESCRIGITVSKKLGGSVERNRLKRQLREVLRACQHLDAGSDYVAIARIGLADVADKRPDELVELIDELAQRLLPTTKSAAKRR